MRRAVLLALAAGCGFKGHSGGNPDGGVIDDAGREVVTWRLDGAADFGKPGASPGETGVEPWGSITSAGYLPGGVVVRGVSSTLWTPGTSDDGLTWDPVATATIAGAGVARAADLDSFSGVAQFGVASGSFSLIIEGQVRLDELGAHLFSLAADDVGFLEVARPGTEQFERVTVARGAGAPSPYTAAVTGWHPFRIGFSASGGSQLQLRHRAPSETVLVPLDRAHIRGRGEAFRGLQRSVFSDELMATQREVVGLDQRAFLQTNFSPGLPGMPGDNEHWSARWSGQFYAAMAGSYQLNVVSDNGNQIVLGTQSASDHWTRGDGQQPANSNVTATLAVGWHPLIIDYNEVTGQNRIDVVVKSSPDGTLVNDQPIPVERLRPVEAGERASAGFDGNDTTIISGNQDPNTRATSNVAFAGFNLERVAAAEVTVRASNPHFEDMNFEVLRPDGMALVLLRPGGLFGPRDETIEWHVTNPTFLSGAPVTGTWRVRAYDDDNSIGNGGDGTLRDAYVTLRTGAGHETVATDAYWTSQLIDLADRTLLDVVTVTWVGRTPRDPSDIELQMRSCAAECTTEAWSDAIPNGMAPGLTAGHRYLQARVRLRSDGTRETELEQLEIVYRRPGS